MSEDKPLGVIITIRDIHEMVQSLQASVMTIDTKVSSVVKLTADLGELESRLRKVETQNAAHWVVHSLTIGGIAAIIGKFLS